MKSRDSWTFGRLLFASSRRFLIDTNHKHEGHNQAIHDRELKEEPEVGMRQLIIMDMLIVFKYSLFGI